MTIWYTLTRMDIIEEIESKIESHEKQVLSVAFRLGMWWRIGYGVLRLILGGVLIKFFIGTPFSDLFYHIMEHEVLKDSSDTIFQFIYGILQDHSFTVTYFVASYLIFFGIIDVVLSLCLLKHKLWAFPLSTGLISLFVLYEIYRIFHTHSLILLCIILIDIFIIFVIHREYLQLQSERNT